MPERVRHDNRFQAYSYNKHKTCGKIPDPDCNVFREAHLGHILILGAGKFGRKAAQVLCGQKNNRITLVDADVDRGKGVAAVGAQFECADSISYLAERLKSADPPDWIVPAVTLHVAFEWLRTTLPEEAGLELLPVPAAVRAQLPNPMEGEGHQVYASYADFICPDDCPEPAEICTYTGQARRGILYRELARIEYADYTPVVVRSRQLTPGLGGFRPDDLFTALGETVSAGGPVLLSTACKCHGVIQAFRIT